MEELGKILKEEKAINNEKGKTDKEHEDEKEVTPILEYSATDENSRRPLTIYLM